MSSPNRKQPRGSRTVAWGLWDMQNVAPSQQQAADVGQRIMAAIKKHESQARVRGRVFYSPSQTQVASQLNDWRRAECEGDCDEEVANDARSIAGENPGSTAIFLVAKDRDYVGSITELKSAGVQVYLVQLGGSASQKLKRAVGAENVITPS